MNKNMTLFKVYLLAGTFTFSGGMAMLPVIERELCDKLNLITKKDLYEYATLSQTFPGVIALTNACFVGKKVNGTVGMIAAGLGAVLPAYILMSIATVLYQLVPQDGIILSILGAIRATSAAFLITAAYSIARYNLNNVVNIGIALVCFILTIFNLVSAPMLIVLAIVFGIILTYGRQVKK